MKRSRGTHGVGARRARASLVTACVVPQLLAVVRSTAVEGVSVTGASVATASCAGWAWYAADVSLVEPR